MILISALTVSLLVPAGPEVRPERGLPSSVVLELELAYSVVGDGEPIRLDRLVAVKRDDHQAWKFLSDVRVPHSSDALITREIVARRLREAGVPAHAFRLSGPAVCQVQRARVRSMGNPSFERKLPTGVMDPVDHLSSKETR